ncbi:uncharacterized protein [Palaemon carinicauda]|uniref:uncharacterized protein n=1 Tax=Palaemon carinicauda TaxID=392227 RepID=UPI0035B5906F
MSESEDHLWPFSLQAGYVGTCQQEGGPANPSGQLSLLICAPPQFLHKQSQILKIKSAIITIAVFSSLFEMDKNQRRLREKETKERDTVQTNPANGLSLKERFLKSRGPIGSSLTTPGIRRQSVSVKRPLDVVLPCQEIQYLDICYQKVGTLTVQFSPIPRKKIAYHPVLHNSIHYCDVPYCGTGERPIKRKPLQRSHSIAVADLREKVDCEWTSSYKLR